MLPDLGLEQITFASESGSELYVFSVQGRRPYTLDARTGALRYQLDYDSDGRLLTVTDGDGNVTSIERNTSGQPVVIIGPYGHRTTLTLDANGHLASVADPLHNTIALNTTLTGLLSRVTTPRGFAFEYTYDDEGRLTRNQDPLNGFQNPLRCAGKQRERRRSRLGLRSAAPRIYKGLQPAHWRTTPCDC